MLKMGQNPLNFISKPLSVCSGRAVLVTEPALLVGEQGTVLPGTWDQPHQHLGIQTLSGKPGQLRNLGSSLSICI